MLFRFYFFFFFLMIRRPPRSTHCISSAASDVYKRQVSTQSTWGQIFFFYYYLINKYFCLYSFAMHFSLIIVASLLLLTVNTQDSYPKFEFTNAKLQTTDNLKEVSGIYEEITKQILENPTIKTIIYILNTQQSGIQILQYLRSQKLKLENFFNLQDKYQNLLNSEYLSYNIQQLISDLKKKFGVQDQNLEQLNQQTHQQFIEKLGSGVEIYNLNDDNLEQFDQQIKKDIDSLLQNKEQKFSIKILFNEKESIRVLEQEVEGSIDQSQLDEEDSTTTINYNLPVSVPLSLIQSSALFGWLTGIFLLTVLYITTCLTLDLETPSKFVKTGLILKLSLIHI
eukprot:TRINITY_DN5913_c0_g1_i2.p1 TRINITY_DN5913_c0_g1~~TRINITY_DN5913_c0_g1_i2.p1  ORF type:complete len:339 (-),score=80.54 TRINITY_DN5913_c0_g1_i2:158-1174(-)